MANGLPQPPIGLSNNDVPDTEVPLLKAILAAVQSGGGGGGAVSSVFARTGAITAQSGDYSAFYQTLTGVLALGGFSSITGLLPTANGGLGVNNYNVGQYAGATGVFAQLTNSQATGAAFSIQNLAAAGYTSFVATADTGSNTTNFAEFGINNSTWSGSGSLNIPLASYVTATGGILALGTTGTYAINFVVNSTVEAANFNGTTGALTLNQNGIGVTPANALILSNSTAAAVGAQQMSPALTLSGAGWSTTSSASQAVAFRQTVTPIQGSTHPTARWALDFSINGAAYQSASTIPFLSVVAPASGLSAHLLINTRTDNTDYSVASSYLAFNGLSTGWSMTDSGFGTVISQSTWNFSGGLAVCTDTAASNQAVLYSGGAANYLRLGYSAASPSSQIFGACGARAGTDTNTTVTNTLTIAGSPNTGTGTGGNLILAVYGSNGSSGTAIGTLNTILTINAARKTVNIAGVPTSSAGLSTGDIYSNAGILTVV